ncbi:acyl-CoA dehydrogenase [Curtobacterium sp. MCBD17_028]|uniref:acyl-CoA dehydrogenase n=1 Tax=Curtobacterium sp. MCBD17_028 TaxID=2175670 RepID=UPI000DA76A9A|nr:acyl-CoA dehydrogenase [Curtobacterium sp. MCBD17_028]PZE27911.1 acyl-CoA dehydrogenase [Curtobacterium sp. MCBD17_028]
MADVPARAARRTKFFAVAAGGALVLGGLGYTLASWTDTEWVFGGTGTDDAPAVGTSQFEVEQSVTAPFVDAASATWTNDAAEPGGSMRFSMPSMSLSPGDTTYASVVLRTTSDSVAGDVALQHAIAAPDTALDQDLWNALTVRVTATPQAGAACDATAFTGAADVIASGALGSAQDATGATQHLTAQSGSLEQYCFAVTLPTGSPDSLQGLSVTPAWQFASTSD